MILRRANKQFAEQKLRITCCWCCCRLCRIMSSATTCRHVYTVLYHTIRWLSLHRQIHPRIYRCFIMKYSLCARSHDPEENRTHGFGNHPVADITRSSSAACIPQSPSLKGNGRTVGREVDKLCPRNVSQSGLCSANRLLSIYQNKSSNLHSVARSSTEQRAEPQSPRFKGIGRHCGAS